MDETLEDNDSTETWRPVVRVLIVDSATFWTADSMTPLRSILSWLRIVEICELSLTKGGRVAGESEMVVREELVEGAFAVGRTVSEKRMFVAAAAAAAGALGARRGVVTGSC